MMLGRLKDLFRGRGGEWIVSFSTNTDPSELFAELDGKDVDIDIKKHFKRRSLDANAYCWVLIDKIAKQTGVKKTEVYRHAIKEIGGVSTIVCVQDKAVEKMREGWEKNGLGWQTDTMQSKMKGCTNVVLYYGSSVYDSAQMAGLINSLIQDAEALGIPTISPEEEKRLLGTWTPKTIDREG